jgi:hypothetical protein
VIQEEWLIFHALPEVYLRNLTADDGGSRPANPTAEHRTRLLEHCPVESQRSRVHRFGIDPT